MGPAPSKPIEDVSDMRCGRNSYFTKVKVRSGNLVDQLQLWCKNSNTPITKGDNGGGENALYECPQGFDQIKFRAGSEHIDSIQFRCSDGNWSPRWGGNLGSEYHRTDCSDKNQVIIGLNSIGKRNGILANGTDIDKTIECGDRMDCLDDNNIFNQECTKRTDTSYKEKLREFCNRNDVNAMSSGCINWCKNNRTSCTRYEDLNDCRTLGITVPECTRAKIDETEGLCLYHKIIQSSVGNVGEHPCNVNSILQLKNECEEYGVSLSSCSPVSLENAKSTALNIAITQEAEEKAAERYNATQQLVVQTLGLSDTPTPTPTPQPVSEDYTTIYIIIVIIFLISLFMSSSTGILLLMKGEE